MKKVYHSSYKPEDIMWIFTILSNQDRTYIDKQDKIITFKYKTENDHLLLSLTRQDPDNFGKGRHSDLTRCRVNLTEDENGTRFEAQLRFPNWDVALPFFLFALLIFIMITSHHMSLLLLGGGLLNLIFLLIIDYRASARGMDYFFNDLIYQVNMGSNLPFDSQTQWICPLCGAVNSNYVGTCGCGCGRCQ